MRIIKQYWEFVREPDGEDILKHIEEAGRTCYKSEDKITGESAEAFINSILKSGHHSVIEHCNISARIVTDRGVTHEIVRHRLASYSQESTRYCNYSKDKFGNEITVILPIWFHEINPDVEYPTHKDTMVLEQYFAWRECCRYTEAKYFELIERGQVAQQARSVLPNSLKTEIVMTCNIREWRHFFKLRCSPKAHPQMQALANSMRAGFAQKVPVLFDNL